MFCTVTQQVSEQKRASLQVTYSGRAFCSRGIQDAVSVLVLCVYSALLGLTGGIEVGVVEGGMGVGGLVVGCRIWGMG